MTLQEEAMKFGTSGEFVPFFSVFTLFRFAQTMFASYFVCFIMYKRSENPASINNQNNNDNFHPCYSAPKLSMIIVELSRALEIKLNCC